MHKAGRTGCVLALLAIVMTAGAISVFADENPTSLCQNASASYQTSTCPCWAVSSSIPGGVTCSDQNLIPGTNMKQTANGVKVDAGATATISLCQTSASPCPIGQSLCRIVTSNKPLFIGTKTLAEWTSFIKWADNNKGTGKPLASSSVCPGSSGLVCGDGNAALEGYACDNGAGNTNVPCVPQGSNISCTYCTLSCTVATVCASGYTLSSDGTTCEANACVSPAPTGETLCNNSNLPSSNGASYQLVSGGLESNCTASSCTAYCSAGYTYSAANGGSCVANTYSCNSSTLQTGWSICNSTAPSSNMSYSLVSSCDSTTPCTADCGTGYTYSAANGGSCVANTYSCQGSISGLLGIMLCPNQSPVNSSTPYAFASTCGTSGCSSANCNAGIACSYVCSGTTCYLQNSTTCEPFSPYCDCNGDTIVCGVCGGSLNASGCCGSQTKDCNGTCGGSASIVCGVCGGSLNGSGCCGSQTKDCNGTCGGSASIVCGVCGGSLNGSGCCGSQTKDCNGTCGGSASIVCGVCGGSLNASGCCGSQTKDCNGTCGGSASIVCGVCGGSLNGSGCCGSQTKDCNGTCGGSATKDACGNCGGGNTCFAGSGPGGTITNGTYSVYYTPNCSSSSVNNGGGTCTYSGCAGGMCCQTNSCSCNNGYKLSGNSCVPICTPYTCAGLGDNCGNPSDGCTSTLSCGSSCPGSETCGGGGTPYVCGCVPNCNCASSTCTGNTCENSCGTGTCSGTETCSCGGSTPCGAYPTCSAIPVNACDCAGDSISCDGSCVAHCSDACNLEGESASSDCPSTFMIEDSHCGCNCGICT